jgi:hypothetical protein
MALVDPVGSGPNPLYDPGYPAEVLRAKQALSVAPTSLDKRLDHFREVFRADPAFEVLHFLPLYFAQAGRTEVFSALYLLAGAEEGIPRVPSARTTFGIAAVGSVLTEPGQRKALGEFVQALAEEWDSFFQAWWLEGAEERAAVESALRTSWQQGFKPVLEPLLKDLGMEGGTAAMAPAIGVEGRIFAGSPRIPGDNVLVIAAPSSPESATAAVYSMLREISFPLVRQAMEQVEGASGGGDERQAVQAAVRAGALILEAHRPDEVSNYQRFFLSQAGLSAPGGADLRVAFEEAYSLDVGLERALREEVLSTRRDGGLG